MADDQELTLDAAMLPYKPLTGDTVTKHIAAIHIAGDLSTTDRKLLNVLLLNAWDDLHRPGVLHSIPVSVVAALIGWSSSNMTPFKTTLEKLNVTRVEFDMLYDDAKEEKLAKKTGKPKRKRWAGIDWTTTTIISGARIVDGMILYEYSTLLRQHLVNPGMYSVISIPVQRDFKRTYALALYENCVRFRDVETTGPISVELWKALLGVDRNRAGVKHEKTAYDDFKHFNNQVIKPSIDEVNNVSDIRIKAEYVKTGRKTTAIAFRITLPEQPSLLEGVLRDDVEIVQSEAYRLLTSIGVGRKLAVEWCAAEPDYALHTARTVKAKVERNEIRNAVGYARRMMDNVPEEFTLEPDPTPVLLPHERPEEIERDRRAGARNSAAARFTLEEEAAMRKKFADEREIRLNDAGEFANAKQRAAFRTWLIQQATEQTV